MWRVDCEWGLCKRPARLRETKYNVNCCGDPNCAEMLTTDWLIRNWRRFGLPPPSPESVHWSWSRITLFDRLRRAAAGLLEGFGELLTQLCGLLSRLIAGRFWRRPEPKDYEEV